ncbi:MAG: DegT/DnrJ/EryC1/StrS family aminotransferase, partial [Chloroflexota bacterium]
MSEVADGLVLRGWAVDPAAGREGPALVAVRDGILERVTWLEGADADGVSPDGLLILPGLVDLHAHFREPGNEDAETVATGLAAAAHGGFTTVCLMPNTTPTIDEPSVVARVRAAADASGSPVRVLVHGAVTSGRKGETLAAMGELADAGVVGFSDDGAPVHAAPIMRNALAYAGALGLPVIEDAAHAVVTQYRGKPAGGIGDVGIFSFDAVKNLAVGEGGAIAARDPEALIRARQLRY